MNGNLPTRGPRLLLGQTGIFGEPLANKYVPSICRNRDSHSRNCLDDLAKFFLALTKCFLHLFALGDMPCDAAITDEASSHVEHRQPGDRRIALATVWRRPTVLQIAEW